MPQAPVRAAAPDYGLINSRAKTILKAIWQNPPAGVLQYRAIATSEAYVLYDLGARRGYAVVWFKSTTEGRCKFPAGDVGYLAALGEFCAAAVIPPLDSRQAALAIG